MLMIKVKNMPQLQLVSMNPLRVARSIHDKSVTYEVIARKANGAKVSLKVEPHEIISIAAEGSLGGW